MAAGSAALLGGAAAAKLICDREATQAASDRKRRFRLEAGETVKQGIGRVARGELDLTIDLLETAPGDDGGAEAVHEARKALKRLRALLRVSRPALEDSRYHRENQTLRDAGRELSGARDAQAMVQTLDSLLKRFGEDLPAGTCSRLRQELDARAREARTSEQGSHENVLEVLGNARMRVSRWPLPEQDGRVLLAGGFEHIYRRGRKAQRRAEADPTPENLHELRKRAKDLWHASQLLEAACPPKLKPLRKQAHRLSDLLGDDHDLCLLLDYARGHPELLRRSDLELLETVVALRGQALRRQALDCAAELYREKPKRMVSRLALG